MKRFIQLTLLLFALTFTFALRMYHVGTYRPPVVPILVTADADEPAGAWVDHETYGINQLILKGAPYARGLEAGHLTEHLLRKQEDELTRRLYRWIPRWIFIALEPIGITYFHGIDAFFESWMAQEMYGVSKSAPHEFDGLADGYTRQIAYHGVHEIGQMVVDQKGDQMGCTVVAAPTAKSWILGRNFDFEGSRIFDTEKIMKWVFPDEGNAFVSVSWAGMVGVVTGVNEKGLYLSMNAAGSKDYRRVGMPSTLVLLKILQYADTAEEALAILRTETMFITDIFVLLDSRAGKLFRVEKSPLRTEVLPLERNSVIANHLLAPSFANDPTNQFRRLELTSEARQTRGEALLNTEFPKGRLARKRDESTILKILRDKGEIDGVPLHLGNRNAIDPLITTHSVIFNGDDQTLYVGKGPGVSGEFLGFDLTASFQGRTPVRKGALPADPVVSPERFEKIRMIEERVVDAEKELRRGNCEAGSKLMSEAGKISNQAGVETYEYITGLGDLEFCRGDLTVAHVHWQRALSLHPAYLSERKALLAKMKGH